MGQDQHDVTHECPQGFSQEKGQSMYWLDAVRDFWSNTGLDTDEMDLRLIVNYFDKIRSDRKTPGPPVTLGSHWVGSVCGWYDITYRVTSLYERKDGIWAILRPVKGMRYEDSDDIHQHTEMVAKRMIPVDPPDLF